MVHGGDILAGVHKVGVDHGGESKGIEQASRRCERTGEIWKQQGSYDSETTGKHSR